LLILFACVPDYFKAKEFDWSWPDGTQLPEAHDEERERLDREDEDEEMDDQVSDEEETDDEMEDESEREASSDEETEDAQTG